MFVLLFIIFALIFAYINYKLDTGQWRPFGKKLLPNNTDKSDCVISNGKEPQTENKEVIVKEPHPLLKEAMKGFDNISSMLYRTNPNLFPLMFEWIKVGEYTKRLRYKSFIIDGTNYAPCITRIIGDEDVYYIEDGDSDLHFKTACLGYVKVTFPKKCKIRLFVKTGDGVLTRPVQLQDNSDVLEVDFSPETIEIEESLILAMKIKRREEEKREKIENIKEKLRKKNRERELEQLALQELMDDGEVFPEANKRPPIPKDVVDAVWKRDGGKCVYCGSTKNLHLDHIIPFSKGGDTCIENLQLLCRECNLRKSNKIG